MIQCDVLVCEQSDRRHDSRQPTSPQSVAALVTHSNVLHVCSSSF